MAKISIKAEKNTPFGGIFHMREHFSRLKSPTANAKLAKVLEETIFRSIKIEFFTRAEVELRSISRHTVDGWTPISRAMRFFLHTLFIPR